MTRVLITGANRGLGLEFCQQYLAKNFNVHAVCRTKTLELEALAVHHYFGFDINQAKDRTTLLEQLRGKKFSLLIHNAGLFLKDDFGQLKKESLALQMETNAFSPLILTQDLAEFLEPQSKVVFISSRMGSIADNSSGGSYGYRISKAALNMAAACLSHELKAKEITVLSLHPGYVKTRMTGGRGNIDVKTSVSGMIRQIEKVNRESDFVFRHSSGEILEW